VGGAVTPRPLASSLCAVLKDHNTFVMSGTVASYW
jgi:hypothetical protein